MKFSKGQILSFYDEKKENRLPFTGRPKKPLRLNTIAKEILMKNWLKIIRGESENASVEISEELAGIDQQIQEAQTKAESLREDLKQAGIKRLAGEGSEKQITKLEADIRVLERDLELLKDVRKSLCERFDDAVVREKSARVAEINRELENLRLEKLKTQDQACELAAQLAVVLYKYNGTNSYEISNLISLDHSQGVRFRSIVQTAIEGQLPFRDQEHRLLTERKTLK